MASQGQNGMSTRTIAPTHHRQLLADIDNHVDSASDLDYTTDDDGHSKASMDADDEPGLVVGFAISHAQSRMRSAQTPAAEKAEVLEASSSYFTAEPDQVIDGPNDSDDRYDPGDPRPDRPTTPRTVQSKSSSSQPTQPVQNQRSSISKTLLGNGTQKGRRRSSSGPTTMLGSLRRLLPGGSTLSQSTTPEVAEPEPENYTRSSSNNLGDPSQPTDGIDNIRSSRFGGKWQPLGLDGNVSSTSITEGGRPKNLRRTTSDNSLYLRRATTGASDFDDTTAYAKVADMPNSRFKAITDSFQDTSIRLPKLPSISIPVSRASSSKTDSDILRQNTLANSGKAKGVKSVTPQASPSLVNSQVTTPRETRHPVLKDALAQATGDIVFMGGYRGSVLRSANPPHQQLWVPVKVGLNLRKVDLEVGLTHEDEERMEEKIVPSGMLSHIGPIDISRRLLKKVRKCPKVRANELRVHDWGYDWRLSPHYLSQRLIQFLETLECNHSETPPEQRGALVVAHSLGGLITRHAVNQRPELFSGVVYVGTPQNCCNILGPLRNGDDVLMSSRVLTAQVNFTLRTSYALLPENGRCFLNKDTGERYDVDFFDVNTWEEHHLSPCINPALPANVKPLAKRKSVVGSLSDSISSYTPSLLNKKSPWFSFEESSSSKDFKDRARDVKDDCENAAKKAGDRIQQASDTTGQSLEPSMKPGHKPSVATHVTIPKSQAWEYLDRTLKEVKEFKQQLIHKPEYQSKNIYPPHAIIFGRSLPTVYGAKVISREAIKYSDAYDDLAFAAGDGVVLASAAQLPTGYRCVRGGRVETDRGHVGLLGDLEAIGQCISAVTEGRRRGIGLGL